MRKPVILAFVLPLVGVTHWHAERDCGLPPEELMARCTVGTKATASGWWCHVNVVQSILRHLMTTIA